MRKEQERRAGLEDQGVVPASILKHETQGSVSPTLGVIHPTPLLDVVGLSQRGLDLGLIGPIREPHSLPHQDTKVLTFYFLSISFILKLETILFMHFLYCQ